MPVSKRKANSISSGGKVFEILLRLWLCCLRSFWRIIIGIGLIKNLQRQGCGSFSLVFHVNLGYRGVPPGCNLSLHGGRRNHRFCNAALL